MRGSEAQDSVSQTNVRAPSQASLRCSSVPSSVFLCVREGRWMGKVGECHVIEQPKPLSKLAFEYRRERCLILKPTREKREISLQDRTLLPASQDQHLPIEPHSIPTWLGLMKFITNQQLLCPGG